MGRPACLVKMMQVVGAHAHFQQAATELDHHFRIVIDTPQQDSLVAQRDTGIGQACTGCDAGWGQFPRMVEVGVEVKRLETGQQPAELGSDPLRQGHRHPAADADHLHVGDTLQAPQNCSEAGVIEQQRVAAGQDDVMNPRCGGDIIKPGSYLRLVESQGFGADPVLTGTEPAVAGALPGDQQQGSIGVAMHHGRHR